MGKQEVSPSTLRRIVGFVDPESWAPDGQLTLVAVASEQERYIVRPEGRGRALFDLINTRVHVTGTVDERDGEMWVAVVSFWTLDDVDDLDLPDGEPDWGDDVEYEAWAGIPTDSFSGYSRR